MTNDVFSIGVNGTNFQNLLMFTGTNGLLPNGSLTLSGSVLYGMTSAGGSNGANDGTIFVLDFRRRRLSSTREIPQSSRAERPLLA